MFLVLVDIEKCNGCRACVNVCPVDVFQLGTDGKVDLFQAGECVGCMSCVEICPCLCVEVRDI